MIEIKYKDNSEVADVTGHTIAEARKQFRAGFGIADKASAFLNGKKISSSGEASTVLNDEDVLVFKKSGGNRIAYLVGALALAMTITGGIFAYGFVNASATINVAPVNYDFASVTANTTSLPSWTARGMQKNATGSGTLFDINTKTSGYTGDLVATVTLANAGDLAKVYRNLTLTIELRDSANNYVDINGDGVANSNDYTYLTLENGSAVLNIKQTIANIYTVKLRSGYYMCNVNSTGWAPGAGTPMLYCEIAQK